VLSALVTLTLATIVGISSAYFGRIVDAVLSRVLDILWAFPIYLLAISLSVVFIHNEISIGPWRIGADSLAVPISIISLVYVPYVARPVRGLVLSLKQREFVTASISAGMPIWRILVFDIFPNIASTIVVFAPLIVALAILTESALSFLSLGVQPPNASWGAISQDGLQLLYTRPLIAFLPGLAIAATVMALNILGDGLRDALDPRSRTRIS
jgi:peptide/nickel transport system permease protein